MSSSIKETYGIDLSHLTTNDIFTSIWGPGSNGIDISGGNGSGLNYSTEPGVGWSKEINGMFVTGFSLQSSGGWNNGSWTWITDPNTGSWVPADGSSDYQYLWPLTNGNSLLLDLPEGAKAIVINLDDMAIVASNYQSPVSSITFTPEASKRYGGYAWYSDNRKASLEIRASIFAHGSAITEPSLAMPISNTTGVTTVAITTPTTDLPDEDPEDSLDLTFNGMTSSYKQGTASSDRLIIRTKSELSESWSLWGGDGDDIITGGRMDDYLIGEKGRDRLTGRAGDDTFVIDDTAKTDLDIIVDFKTKDDIIAFSSNLFDIQGGEDISVITLKDVKDGDVATATFADLEADAYIFIGNKRDITQVLQLDLSDKIRVFVDTSRKQIMCDLNSDWSDGLDPIIKFAGRMPRGWSESNFLFGLEL